MSTKARTQPPVPAAAQVEGATERFVAAYEEFAANGASRAPDWMRELRRSALERFKAHGFPTTKQERWRFTSVDPIARTAFVSASPAPAGRMPSLEEHLIGDADARLVAITLNGRHEPSLVGSAAPPDGVVISSLADAAASHGDLVRKHLAQYADVDANPFTALGTAFLADGVFVYVPRGMMVDQPIQIVHAASAGKEPAVLHPRTLVVVEESAQVSLIETYTGGASVYWTNAATEIVLGENAVVDAYRVQREGARAFHTAIVQSHQARNSVYSLNAFAFGSALTRTDVNAVLDGEGAEATLNGLTLVAGRQHVDYHTTIDHAKPHCNSWELFNGIYDGHARGVFTGRIVVRPGAQKTDSKQTNNNLLLSKTARADSQPQLEIYADDVKCTHGATLGPIDEKSMFYLRSRGLDEDRARNLLTYGFGAEILNSVSIDALSRKLDGLVHELLHDEVAQRTGE